ncbi:hypothetical protein CYY_009355 [Polysphondylium violaceum]|uniref:Phytanoyl-CoA dioxygenase family protein n=1 Tax=Polysphondylium violaceum TaxID=133409 RepID=A0A8J4PKA6_9MYCE|nr:hypothetical protein CYY_009355 [Polysphondylium violaceum]
MEQTQDHSFCLSKSQKDSFENDGFLIIDDIIADKQLIQTIRERIKPLFAGDFTTGIFPDEWYGRPGLSKEDITKEMVNAWKSDHNIARLVLSEKLGKLAADLMGWTGARIAQDDIFWKPVSGKPIGFHQDQPYMSFFNPSQVVTVWIAITDVSKENGTLEYALGSHKWTHDSTLKDQFHAPTDYMYTLVNAAHKQGIESPVIVPVETKSGGCSVHHGKTYHGSATNPSESRERISIAIHYLPSECEFLSDKPAGYIYGRYKIHNSTTMDETFFPITYTQSGYRSPCINDFIKDPLSK